MTIPATTRTVVHVLRHGEVYNPDKILYGRIPGYRLSDRGRDQAELALVAAREHGFALIERLALQVLSVTASRS